VPSAGSLGVGVGLNVCDDSVDNVGAGVLALATCIAVALGVAVGFWFFAILPAFPAGVGFVVFDGGGGGVTAGVPTAWAGSTRTSWFSLGGGVPLGEIPGIAIMPGATGSC
jgi:hypothetical protein